MLPNRIREHRERANLTLEELAERVGTSPQHISRLEKGQRRLSDPWLDRLSVALSIRKADFLVDLSGIPPEDREFAKDQTEARILRTWRGLDPEEQEFLLRYLNRLGSGDA